MYTYAIGLLVSRVSEKQRQINYRYFIVRKLILRLKIDSMQSAAKFSKLLEFKTEQRKNALNCLFDKLNLIQLPYN